MCKNVGYKANILLLNLPFQFLNCVKMTQIINFSKMRLAGTLGHLSHLSPSKIKLPNSGGTNVQTRFCILFYFLLVRKWKKTKISF